MGKTIWFDFENAPHVWVLKPLYEYFVKKGYNCYCSARRFSYTIELLKHAGIAAAVQPWHVSSSKFVKAFNILLRVQRLVSLYRRKHILLAVSHGSRSQILAARLMKIPVISMEDYERSDQFMVRFTTSTLVPDVIDKSHWGRYKDRIAQYPGLKENIYLPDLEISNSESREERIVVVLRPEATTGHYYRKRSTFLLHHLILHLGKSRDIKIVFLPRNMRQQVETTEIFKKLGMVYEIPAAGAYGFEIVARADMVIGGGGTMLREAACLGIPSYSYFAGEQGDVDAYLESIGRLKRIDSEEDIVKIKPAKRSPISKNEDLRARQYIVEFIEKYLRSLDVNGSYSN